MAGDSSPASTQSYKGKSGAIPKMTVFVNVVMRFVDFRE